MVFTLNMGLKLLRSKLFYSLRLPIQSNAMGRWPKCYAGGHESLGDKCCFAANSFIVSGSPSNPMLWGGKLNAIVAIVVLGFNFYIVPYFLVLYHYSLAFRSYLSWGWLAIRTFGPRCSRLDATHGFAEVAESNLFIAARAAFFIGRNFLQKAKTTLGISQLQFHTLLLLF